MPGPRPTSSTAEPAPAVPAAGKAPAKRAAAKRAPATRRATVSTEKAQRSASAVDSYADKPWVASYPTGVPATYEFPKFAVTRLLDDAAASFPSHVALAFLGSKTTYKDLKHQVDQFAGALAGLGVGKGDRVALVLPNCPQNVIAFFAALRLGAVVVEHNPLYTEAELRHQLADCGAKVVICLDRVYETVAKVKADTALEHIVTTSLVDFLSRGNQLKLKLPIKKAKKQRAEISATVPKGAAVKDFSALLKGAAAQTRQTPVEPEDLALLQYTGGTTGLSKGAMLSHRNLVSNAYMNRLWDTEAKAGKEVTLAVLPLFHAYGLTVAMTNTILLGGTLVLLPRFDLDLVFQAIDQWKPTLFPGVPPIYKAIADSPKAKSHDLKSIRLCVSGAMKLPTDIKEQFTKISGAVLIEGYGMTETSPSTHANPTHGPGKAGSIGLPLPGTACKIVDQDDSTKLVPVGSPGELAIAGPQVFSGYWNRENQDGVFTADGYVLTGDVAVMDDEGYFTIVDRKKELIIAGGFNIYPSEVEEVLFGLDGVADAVVIGVPDKYRGETVKAFVVKASGSTLTEEDVVAHCAASLTAYKVPKLVEFRAELPRSTVGKVLRRVLVEEERAKAAGASPVPASVPTSAPKAAKPVPAAAITPEATAPGATAPAKKTSARPAAKRAAKAPTAAAPAAPAASAKRVAAKKVTPATTPDAAVTPTESVVLPAPPAAKPPAKRTSSAKIPAAKAPAAKAAAAKAPAKKAAALPVPAAAPVEPALPLPAKAPSAKRSPAAKAPATSPATSPAKRTPTKKAPTSD